LPPIPASFQNITEGDDSGIYSAEGWYDLFSSHGRCIMYDPRIKAVFASSYNISDQKHYE
jgi:hypothetical protein